MSTLEPGGDQGLHTMLLPDRPSFFSAEFRTWRRRVHGLIGSADERD